ncbi:MAG: YigZ family protein [Paramuribaculum sp.]|nr:YigZ family protein [Paramuribaculum sp.]
MDGDRTSDYLTLESESRAVIREKMSKFIAIAFPIISADDAKTRIKKIANDYHDARHVCWAYVAGTNGDDWMANDNGEPSGTAGRPILGQIRSAGLTNVAVAVVRYFGGIKLGTSGLIEAYKEAARAAIAEGTKIIKTEETLLSISFNYADMQPVMKLLKSFDGKIMNQNFEMICRLDYLIRKDKSEEITARLSGIATVGEIGDVAG